MMSIGSRDLGPRRSWHYVATYCLAAAAVYITAFPMLERQALPVKVKRE